MKKGDANINVDEIKIKIAPGLERVARKIGSRIELDFERSIDMFYEDYDPRYYKRTSNTYKASSGYKNPNSTWIKIGDLEYECGIDVDPSNMDQGAYAKKGGWGSHGLATPDFIFPRTFVRGIHGFTRATLQKNDKWRPGLRFSSNDIDLLASVYGPSPLKTYKESTIPPKMSPPPQRIMNQRFKETCKEIKPMLDAEMKKAGLEVV